jgi:hypothetical protein
VKCHRKDGLDLRDRAGMSEGGADGGFYKDRGCTDEQERNFNAQDPGRLVIYQGL